MVSGCEIFEFRIAGTVGFGLVAVNLVECFFEFKSSAFKFDLDKRQAVGSWLVRSKN